MCWQWTYLQYFTVGIGNYQATTPRTITYRLGASTIKNQIVHNQTLCHGKLLVQPLAAINGYQLQRLLYSGACQAVVRVQLLRGGRMSIFSICLESYSIPVSGLMKVHSRCDIQWYPFFLVLSRLFMLEHLSFPRRLPQQKRCQRSPSPRHSKEAEDLFLRTGRRLFQTWDHRWSNGELDDFSWFLASKRSKKTLPGCNCSVFLGFAEKTFCIFGTP